MIFFYDIFPGGRKILGDLGVSLHALATWWDDFRGGQEKRPLRQRQTARHRDLHERSRPVGRRPMAALPRLRSKAFCTRRVSARGQSPEPGAAAAGPWPTELRLQKDRKTLVAFDDG